MHHLRRTYFPLQKKAHEFSVCSTHDKDNNNKNKRKTKNKIFILRLMSFTVVVPRRSVVVVVLERIWNLYLTWKK